MANKSSNDFSLRFYKDYSKIREILVSSIKEDISLYQKIVFSQQIIFSHFVISFLIKKGLIRREDNTTFTYQDFFMALLSNESYIAKFLEVSSFSRSFSPDTTFRLNGNKYIIRFLNSEFFNLLSQINSKSFVLENESIGEILDFINYYFENPYFSFDVFGVVFEQDLNFLEALRIEQIDFDQNYKLLLRLSERRKKGIYYTPEEITNYICRKSLLHSLQEHCNFPNEKFETAIAKMNRTELLKVNNFIIKLKILDPACGSGNFLLEMCELLFEIRKLVLQKLGKKVNHYNLKYEILLSNIHGVDIQKIAISITTLRLWLWLLEDWSMTHRNRDLLLPDLIPNLQTGNSLIGFSIEKIEKQDDDFKIKSEIQKLVIDSQKKLLGIEKIEENNDILLSFNDIVSTLKTISTNQRIFTNQELLQVTFRNLQKQIRRKNIDSKIRNELKEKYTEVKKLLYEILNYKFKEMINKRNKKIELSLEELKLLQPFHWNTDFFDIINNGGFDIIIGNPPYLENKKLRNKIEKNLLKVMFKSAYKLYDLSILFIERSHKVLKEKGQFSFIITNKFISTDYGIKIRKLILLETRLNEVISVSDLPIFEDAAIYPIILSFTKASSTLDVDNLTNEFGVLPCISDVKYLNEHDMPKIMIRQSYFYRLPKHVFALSGNSPLITEILNNPKHVRLSEIGKFAYRILGFTDWEKSLDSLSTKISSKKDLRFIGTTNVSQYAVDWKKTLKLRGKRLVRTYLPYTKNLEATWNTFKREKILIKEISKKLTASYDSGLFANATGIYMFMPKKDYNPKLLTIILNSHLMRFIFYILFGSTHMAGKYLRFNGSYLGELPILIPKYDWQQKILIHLCEYLSFLYQLKIDEQFDLQLIVWTERVANGLVMETYLENIFERSIFEELKDKVRPIDYDKWFLLNLINTRNENYKEITQEILQIISSTLTTIFNETKYKEIMDEITEKDEFSF